jgi:DNA polymerase-3 subunit alpha
MAALMTTEMDNTDKITKYINDARNHQIPVLPPDVNQSQKRFSVERVAGGRKAIRFGLEAIKGVGGIAVDTILEARKSGSFQTILDFCRRVQTRKVNKKVLESLCLAGAFDSIAEINRPSLFASLEGLLEYAGEEQEERERGQVSFFDSFSSEEVQLVTPLTALFKQEPEWPSAKKLSLEKEVVGFYISGHPMDPWQKICEQWLGWNSERIKQMTSEGGVKQQRGQKTEIKLAGLLADVREVTTKKGSKMAFAHLEDLKGKIEMVFFPEAYASVQPMLKQATTEAEPVIVTGDIELSEEAPKILFKSMEWAADAHRNRVQQVTIQLILPEVTPDQLRELKKQLLKNRGKCPVKIQFRDPSFQTGLELPKTLSIAPTPHAIGEINRIFGKDVVTLG